MGPSYATIGSLTDINLDGVSGIVSDLDYTLTDFGAGHAAALTRLAKVYGDPFAEKFAHTFQLVLDGSRKAKSQVWEQRGEYRNLIGRIMDRQGASDMNVRPWSRETWMQLISERLNLNLSQGQIETARDTYWRTVGKSSPMYPDASEFVARLDELDIPLILMTASDSPLKPTEDGSFQYDPVFAKEYKERRLALLRFAPFRTIIGDPHDKPDRRFFDQVDAVVAVAGLADKRSVLAIGDSPHADLEEPAKRGYYAVHIKRD